MGDSVESQLVNGVISKLAIVKDKPRNVFGVSVTDATVAEKFNLKNPTRKDRANLAYILREDKRKEVDEYVRWLMQEYHDDEKTVTKIATICTIYNATGVTLKLFKNHDFSGHIRGDPYPSHIENGQWAVFLHVDGSSAAVLYRGESDECGGEERVWLHAWNNVPKVYTEIQRPDHYNTYNWDYVFELIKNEKYHKGMPINECCSPESCISQDSIYKYSGIMTWEASLDCTCTT